MKRLIPFAFAAALACGSNPSIVPSGDFSGPQGLAVAPLPDRDLLFIANQGANELRAITLCATSPQQAASCPTSQDLQFLPAPVRLFAGSILVGERPVRLAGVPLQTADNPPVPHGAVLVAGLGVPNAAGTIDPVLQVVDAQNILSASQTKPATPCNGSAQPGCAALPNKVAMPASPIDVVAVDTPGTSIGAVAVTQGPGTGGTVVVLNVTLGSDGLATATPLKRCALDFIPTRVALIPACQPGTTPGSAACTDDLDPAQAPGTKMPLHVYVADGTPGGTPGGIGDGLVEVAVPSIPGVPSPDTGASPACASVRRIPASDPQDSPRRARRLKSIALSPPSLGAPPDPSSLPPVLPAGRIILGVTLDDAALCADHGPRVCPPEVSAPAGALCVDQGMLNCGAGRIVMLNNDPVNGTSSVFDAPTPPTPQVTPPTPPAPPAPRLPLQPLRPPAAAREVAFMGRTQCPTPATAQTPLPPCTAVRAGLSATVVGVNPTIIQRSVIGLASTEDGSTVFIDTDNKRFFDDLRDTNTSPPLPAPSCPNAPCPPLGVTFAPAAVDASGNTIAGDKQNAAWLNPGITRPSQWRLAWHDAIRGLESISGNLSRTAGGPIRLTLPAGKDLTPWVSSPELQLGAPSTCAVPYPDCVGDFVRVKSYSPTANCADLAVVPLTTDIPIVAVHPDGLDLQPVPGFDPDPACFASGKVGGTFEVHAGETAAGGWMVLEDLDVLGRVPHNVQLIVTGPRFDYPVSQYPYPVTPPATDIAFSFTMTGAEPTIAGSFFVLSLSSGRNVTFVRDPIIASATPGFAGPILVYGSLRRPNDEVTITANTGSNSVLMTIPAQLGFSGSVRVFY